jgi:PKD repeat protein
MTSDLEDPVHAYAEGGCYTVTLTASNACAIDTWTEEVCVEAACEPVAGVDFMWEPEVGIVGEDVMFTAMEPMTGTAPFTYTWDFGDDGTGMGMMATHVYAAAGVYTVTLTVENACGMATAVHEVMVETGVMEIYIPVVLRNS